MGVGKSTHTTLSEVTDRAEGRMGRLSVEGRYHRFPMRLEDDYTVEKKVLGSGYNGAVRLAVRNDSGARHAVKAFKLHGVTKEKKAELASEAEIFLGMDHPHVARLHDVYESGDQLTMVMECMEGGELFDRVAERKVFSEKDAVHTSWQMLLAVNYLHSCGIVHRDLKLENFLYERKDSDFLKLIDFGFSKIWAKNTKMEVSCGTLSYVAPEVLAQSYTSQCDLWSLGVIVFVLLVGYMPFGGSSERQQVIAIQSGKCGMKKDRWAKVSPQGLDFVKKLLVVNPEVRLTALQALEHPWILNRDVALEPGLGLDQSVADALCNFSRQTQFRQACMQLMAWSLNATERGEVRQAFLELDLNKSGKIKLSVLKKVLEAKFHVPEDESVQVFRALDANSDEEIFYSEFLAAMMTSRLALHDGLLKATFRRFDVQNTGFITRQDLSQVLGGAIKPDDVMKEVDTDHDGQISYDEFMAYLRNGCAQDHHVEAAEKVIDEALQVTEPSSGSAGAPPDASDSGPAVRLRKRDRLRAFLNDLSGMT